MAEGIVWEEYNDETGQSYSVMEMDGWYYPQVYSKEHEGYITEVDEKNFGGEVRFPRLEQAKDYIEKKARKKEPFWFRKLW